MFRLKSKRSVATILLSPILAVTLLSCASEPSITAAPSQTPAGKEALTPSPIAPSAAPTTLEKLEGEEIKIKCGDLLSLQELYDFNPNFALDPELSAVQPMIEAQFRDIGGMTCSYLNLTSGDVIQVSIAKVKDTSKRTLLSSVAEASSAASNFDSDERKVFFNLSNGSGIFQAVQGQYWLSASSSIFSSAGDAYGFIYPALNRL